MPLLYINEEGEKKEKYVLFADDAAKTLQVLVSVTLHNACYLTHFPIPFSLCRSLRRR